MTEKTPAPIADAMNTVALAVDPRVEKACYLVSDGKLHYHLMIAGKWLKLDEWAADLEARRLMTVRQ